MHIGDRYDRLEHLYGLVVIMRERQRIYFRERTQENLSESKQAEFAVDKALKELKEPVGLF